MKLRRSLRKFEKQLETWIDGGSRHSRHLLRNVGLVSAGVTALAVGVVVGRELRVRYKFVRQTPYDLYAHAGDTDGMEFGVGI